MHLFLWEGMEVRDLVPKLLSCWKAITGGKATRQKVSLKPDSYLKYPGYAISDTGTGEQRVYVLQENNIGSVRKQ